MRSNVALITACLAGLSAASHAQQAIPSPFHPVGEMHGGALVELALAGDVPDLAPGEGVQWSGFPLPFGGGADLSLEAFSVFGERARIVVVDELGERDVAPPDVLLLMGTVDGDASSRVFLSISEHAVEGHVYTEGRYLVVSSGPHGAGLPTVIYEPAGLEPGVLELLAWECRAGELPRPGFVMPVGGESSGSRSLPCRVAELAFETDTEYTMNLFGGSEEAASAYTATLVGALTQIYTQEVNTRFEVVFLRLWTGPDPWNQNNTVNQLFQFQDYWNANMTHIQRNAAHFLSGRPLGGGVAYLPGLCWPEYDYGLSANLNGFFPVPIEDNHAQNWDLMVTAHELGHNFGAPHTHSKNPKIDDCAGGDCSVTPNGTIMSYCHLCPGGLANIILELHHRIISEDILPWLDAEQFCSLLVDEVSITQHPADATVCEGGTAEFSVSATGYGPLAFQWRRNGADLPGETGQTLVLGAVGPGDAGSYDVVVTNPCGSAPSTPAVLAVSDPCPADMDGNCIIDSQDFLIFLNLFVAGDPEADFNGDGVVDTRDFVAFLNAYVEGC